MSILDDIRNEADKLKQYAAFVAAVQAATGIGGLPAAEVIAIIKAALGALASGASGALTTDQVMAELGALTSGEAADDAAAQAVLDARPTGGA
jgi:hypothetical protein